MTTTTHQPESLRRVIARRLARPAALALGVLAVTALFTGSASAAVPGLVMVGSLGGNNSLTPKGVAALCPTGKKVIGGGARVVLPGSNVAQGGGGEVALEGVMTAGPTRAIAGARERQDGTVEPWSVRAYAICANPLPGYETVRKLSASDSSTTKSLTVGCPSGKVVLGAGAQLSSSAAMPVVLSDLAKVGCQARAIATEDQVGHAADWRLVVEAICASA